MTEPDRLRRVGEQMQFALLLLVLASTGPATPPAPPEAPVYALAQVDAPPTLKFAAKAPYPFEMRRLGVPGEVVVEFVVDEGGQVTAPKLVSATRPDFERAAFTTITKWRFEPARKNGQPVRVRLTAPIRFELE